MKKANFEGLAQGLSEAVELNNKVDKLAYLLVTCREDNLTDKQVALKILDHLNLCKVYFVGNQSDS